MKLKALVLALIMMFAVPSFASVSLDTRGLTEAQQAELVLQAEQMKKEAKAIPVATVDQVAKYVEIGERAGKAVAAFAKEVGVAGDRFLESNTGKLIAVLVVFNYGGGQLLNTMIHVGLGVAFFIVFLPIWFYSMKRSAYNKYVEVRQLKKPFQKRDGEVVDKVEDFAVVKYESDGEKVFLHWIGLAIGIAVSLFIIFTY